MAQVSPQSGSSEVYQTDSGSADRRSPLLTDQAERNGYDDFDRDHLTNLLRSDTAVAVSVPPYRLESDSRQRRRSPLFQRFLDLPISNKQFLGLLTSEVISVVGLVGVGAFLIITTGQSQLENQTRSELVVTDTNYKTKVDQMGFGFRSQSDNSVIITAAKAAAKGEALNSETRSQVRQVLRNEVIAQRIEYATLVGKDLKIIVSANADRTGSTFDPNQLVSKALKEGRQIQSSEIVSWTELNKEIPPLLHELAEQDALIRYVATPVKDPATGNVVAVLLSGDIVNDKLPIVLNTIDAFRGGYSAVYQRQSSGKFVLATAIEQQPGRKLEQAKANVALSDTTLLENAIKAAGQPVTQQVKIGEQTYTMAAKALTNYAGQPIAVLLRGTPATFLNRLIWDSLLLQLVVTVMAILANILLALLLGRIIARPLKKLQQATQQFSEGNLQARAEAFAADEVGQLSTAFNTMADRLEANIGEIRQTETLLAQEAAIAQQARQEAEVARQQAETLAQEQRQLKENLQRRALELLQEIDPISQGDLTIEVKVTDDEIGTIADSYNATVESLREIVHQVQTAATQVVEATKGSHTYIQELSTEASQQAEEIAAAMKRVQEMTSAAHIVATNAEQAKAVMQQAVQTVETGDFAMNRTVDGIRSIRTTVAATAKKVKHLGESSQKISTVVDLIGTFAEQTKMLALNASIEAALAGEGGRGFAVVADEVRTLARQSEEATEEIRQIVASIQAETNEVMMAMETGTQQVVIGTSLVDETRQSLTQITTASAQISQLVNAITQATILQTQASEAVSQTMKDVAASSSKTSAEANQVSSSFGQLQQVAQTLQQGVSRFKVN